MLLTWNNLHYYQQLMHAAREAIAAGRVAGMVEEVRAGWAEGQRMRS
jgi:queuine tRNA-ribosyltransferase